MAVSKAKKRTELVKNAVQNRCKVPSALTPPSDSVQAGKSCHDDWLMISLQLAQSRGGGADLVWGQEHTHLDPSSLL